MSLFEFGFSELVGGVIEGIVLSEILNVLLPLIPQYAWMFYLALFIVSLGTSFAFMTARLTYVAGWLFGAWLFLPLMTPIDILLNIGIPIVGVIIGMYFRH